MLHSPRTQRLVPTDRADVLALKAALDRRLKDEGETVSAFDCAFEALVEQVRAGCNERGELLARIRDWQLRHIWWQELELRRARQEAHQAAEQCEQLLAELDELREGAVEGDAQGDGAQGNRVTLDVPASGTGGGSDSFQPKRASRSSVYKRPSMAAGVLRVEADVDDDAVLEHTASLTDEEVSDLCAKLIEQIGSRRGPDVLATVLSSCVDHMPEEELTDLLQGAVISSRRRVAMTAALQTLQRISPEESLDVVRLAVSQWPAAQLISLACALHKELAPEVRADPDEPR